MRNRTGRRACAGDIGSDFINVLASYLEKLAAQPLQYTKSGGERCAGSERRSYRLTSQSWSPQGLVQPAGWRHAVNLYIPDNAVTKRAVVVVNNGISHNIESTDPVPPADFTAATLAAIAHATHSIVVSISDVPNQYLAYQDDRKPRKEDDSVAHSWRLFMDAPAQRPAMSLHVPMAAAISQVMTLAQRELTPWGVDRFIVSGASKRAWAAWLSAIADPRVDAIAPFAMDLLGTRAALRHMYRSYGGNWPIAFYSFYAEHLDERIDSAAFSGLMQIEDPLQYLGTRYRSRLRIPKYIINASGDDLFVPDNTRVYWDRLPGDKALRVVPNTDHRGVVTKSAEQSLIAFVNRIQQSAALPVIDTTVRQPGDSPILTVYFSERPTRITLWTAANPVTRDFRYACGIRYAATPLPLTATQSVEVPLQKPATGWQAVFVEATFGDGFIATTPVFISPDEAYPTVVPPSDGAACQTLPGRGFSAHVSPQDCADGPTRHRNAAQRNTSSTGYGSVMINGTD